MSTRERPPPPLDYPRLFFELGASAGQSTKPPPKPPKPLKRERHDEHTEHEPNVGQRRVDARR